MASCSSTFNLNIELSDAGTYIFSETAMDFTVTTSHPTRVGGSVKITVDRVGQGQGCTAMNDATNVVLMLPSSSELLGQPSQVTCKK